MIMTNKLKLAILPFVIIYIFFITPVAKAGPQSTTYELKEFGFGSGGDSGIESTTYSLFGTTGETDAGSADSTTYTIKGGLIYTVQAAVPPAPTVTNPGTNYDRLLITLQTGGNPSDTVYAVSVFDGSTTRYAQSDYTMGSTLGAEDWLLYSGGITVGWGGASGFYLTNLKNNTTYTVKVKASQGDYTETAWGPSTNQTTSDPTFTFGVDSSTITFANLNSGNSYTDSSKTTILTTSTNAYNGYIVYAHETQPLTHVDNGAITIADYAGTNTTPTTWSSTGFGYTTDDSNLSGGSSNRFTSGGPKYAGFIVAAPGDPVADHLGPILSPISSETFTLSYRVTAEATTNAGQYRTTVIYVAVPTY